MKTFGGYISTISRGLFGLLSGVAFTGWSQGTILFDTRVEGVVDARFLTAQCQPGSGEDFVAQMFIGGTPESLVPVGTPTPFGTGPDAGYLDGGEVMIPHLVPLSQAFVVIMYWEAGHASFPEAQAAGAAFGSTMIISVTLVGPNDSTDLSHSGGKLIGLGSFGVPCPVAGVELGIQRSATSTTLSWNQPSDPVAVVVLQESEFPAGPWTDISVSWNSQNGGKTTPPNPLTLISTNLSKFYRARLTTATGP